MKLSIIALAVNLVVSFKIDRLKKFEKNRNDFGDITVNFQIYTLLCYYSTLLLTDLTKDYQDTHIMTQPDQNFKLTEMKSMSVYNELIKMFPDEELILNL